MKSKIFWIILTIAVVILFWPFKWPTLPSLPFNFGGTSEEEVIIDTNNALVDSLKKKIEADDVLRQEYEKQAQELKDSLVILKKEFSQDQIQIQELRNANSKKVYNVVKLSSDELSKFVTDRYKDSTEKR